MNLPDGIDEATWAKALKNYGHPWREGQICEGVTLNLPTNWFSRCGACGLVEEDEKTGKLPAHAAPMPSPTKELLWDMQLEGGKHFDFCLAMRDWWMLHKYTDVESLAATVIRAWASMGKK